MVRAGMYSISAAVGALALTLALEWGGTQATGPADAGSRAGHPGISIVPKSHPKSVDSRASVASQIPHDNPRVRLVSLETEVAFETTGKVDTESAASTYFDGRFLFPGRFASFDERFAGASVSPVLGAAYAAETRQRASLPPDPAGEAAQPGLGRPGRGLAPVTRLPPAAASRKDGRTREANNDPSGLPDSDSRTAIYDIAAHIVYLPDGRRLEAHSGLGSHMDDPRYVAVKHRGPTPPNVYNLALREQPFHGVRAIRLIPVDGDKMFGRDGMLAHSYMLGANGESNGCVSFNDYPAFLDAFLKGDVDRLVVVERLDSPPASGPSGWFREAIRKLFKPFEGEVRT